LHQIYVDKIDGKVTDEFYENTVDKWQEELGQIKESIRRHEDGDAHYLSQGIHILELCNKAHRLYLQQTPIKRAKLLRYILSNCTLLDGSLTPTYRKPSTCWPKGSPVLKCSPARTRTSDLVVTLNPVLLPEVDYLFSMVGGSPIEGKILSAQL